MLLSDVPKGGFEPPIMSYPIYYLPSTPDQ